MTKAKEKAIGKTDSKEAVDAKNTKDTNVDQKEQREDVVGTAADPKAPEAGSIGTDDGGKKVVDDLSKEDTNVREGASVADGNERIGMNDGTVGTREDLEPGSTIIGEEGPANGLNAEDRLPEPTNKEGVAPGQLNPSPTTDPLINSLYDPLQAGSVRTGAVDADGNAVIADRAGFDPQDPRYLDIPVTQLEAVKACVSRIETARRHGNTVSAQRALKDLSEALGPLDGGSSNLREWANAQRDELDAEANKAYRKEQRDAKKADSDK